MCFDHLLYTDYQNAKKIESVCNQSNNKQTRLFTYFILAFRAISNKLWGKWQ